MKPGWQLDGCSTLDFNQKKYEGQQFEVNINVYKVLCPYVQKTFWIHGSLVTRDSWNVTTSYIENFFCNIRSVVLRVKWILSESDFLLTKRMHINTVFIDIFLDVGSNETNILDTPESISSWVSSATTAFHQILLRLVMLRIASSIADLFFQSGDS